MNSLEFIDKLIQYNKAQLAKYPLSGKLLDPNYKYKEADIVYKCNQYYTEQLQILEQIKFELKAWEICKNKLNLKVQTEEAVTEGFCMKGYWLLVEQYPYTQTTILEREEYDILKKALEVQNEKSN